jgi:saccharopine dehydrogenase-like NADP-dependent oxidoreductase
MLPKRVVRLRGEHEFENSRIEALKKKRDRQFKKFKKTGNEKYYRKSKSLTKTLVKVIKKEQKRVFRAKLNSHGVQSFWKTVGDLFATTSKDEFQLKINGSNTTDGEVVAQAFASFFEQKILDLITYGTFF